MNLRWDARALQDLRDIRSYIAVHGSPAAADRVRQRTEILLIAAIGAGLSKPVESKRVFAVGTEMMQLGKPLLRLEDARNRHDD